MVNGEVVLTKTEKEFLEKFDNHEKCSKRDLEECLPDECEYKHSSSVICSNATHSIFKIGRRYFAICSLGEYDVGPIEVDVDYTAPLHGIQYVAKKLLDFNGNLINFSPIGYWSDNQRTKELCVLPLEFDASMEKILLTPVFNFWNKQTKEIIVIKSEIISISKIPKFSKTNFANTSAKIMLDSIKEEFVEMGEKFFRNENLNSYGLSVYACSKDFYSFMEDAHDGNSEFYKVVFETYKNVFFRIFECCEWFLSKDNKKG